MLSIYTENANKEVILKMKKFLLKVFDEYINSKVMFKG